MQKSPYQAVAAKMPVILVNKALSTLLWCLLYHFSAANSGHPQRSPQKESFDIVWAYVFTDGTLFLSPNRLLWSTDCRENLYYVRKKTTKYVQMLAAHLSWHDNITVNDKKPTKHREHFSHLLQKSFAITLTKHSGNIIYKRAAIQIDKQWDVHWLESIPLPGAKTNGSLL